MRRMNLRWGSWIGAVLGMALQGGCFVEPDSDADPPSTESTGASCVPGSEGCICLELQCEVGLVCMGSVCVSEMSTGASSTSGMGSTSSMGSTSAGASETTAADSGSTGGTSQGGTTTSGSETTAEGMCGDLILDPDEECDGGSMYCTADCELENHDCNPLNNYPCQEGSKCSWTPGEENQARFTCRPLAAEPLEQGQGDCFEMDVSVDANCALGLACYLGTQLAECNGSADGCCAAYCDTANMGQECPGSDVCVAETGIAPGLPQLGVCRPA